MLKKNFRLCDNIARFSLLATVLLTIIAFVPGGFVSIVLLKGYVLVVGVSVAFVAWLMGRLMEGAVTFSRSWILISTGVLLVSILASTFFSSTPYLSLFGEQLDQGAFVPFAFMCVGLFLASQLFQDKKSLSYFFSSAYVLYGVIALYQLAHLFFARALSFGMFTANVSTPLGLWSDFAYLSGAMLIGAVIVHEFFHLPKIIRSLMFSAGVLALFFVATTNILLVWMLVGLSMLLILVYRLLFSEETDGSRFPIVSFLLTLGALFFSITNASFGGRLASLLHASYLGVDPSFSVTVHVAYESIKAHLIFGAGPNRFFHEWIAYRPLSVNANMLWNSIFSFGSSFLLTITTLAGILGVLSGLFFVGSFFYEGWNNLFRQSFRTQNERIHPGIFATFVLTLYFFLIILFASPGTGITFLSFFWIGLFIAVLSSAGLIEKHTFEFAQKKFFGVIAICVVVLGVTVSFLSSIGATKRLIVAVHYANGVHSANAGNVAEADLQFMRAITTVDLPSIERDRVQLAVDTIQAEFTNVPSNTAQLSVDSRNTIQNAIKVGTAASLAAVSLDPSDVQNYLVYGDFMRSLSPLKIQESFNNARDAYLKAVNVAPNYPVSYYDLARLYAGSGDSKNATVYATQALAIKPNYEEVFYLEAQLALAQSDVDTAVTILKKAISTDPSNSQIYSELGQVQYKAGRYTDAVASFGSATALDSSDTNSWYYLAQAFAKTGDQKEASMILTALHARYPDNKDISNALLSLTTPTVAPTVLDTSKMKKSSTVIPKAKK